MSPPRETFSAMIADSSSYQRGLLAGLVRSSGAARVQLAESADEGLRILKDADPDLVVMDYAIGPGGALEMCRSIRRDGAVPNRAVPIIVLASAPTRAGIEGLRAMGVDAVLAKPCSLLMMKDKVEAVMTEGRPFIVSADYVGPCRRRRQDPDYRGPMRRMSDPEQTTQPQAQYQPPALVMEALARLSAAALALHEGGAVQQVLSKTLSVRAAGLEVDDLDLAQGAQELLRYLEAVGATARLSPQAVQVHIEALNQIVALPPDQKQMRARLSEGLKRLVSKKLQSTLAR